MIQGCFNLFLFVLFDFRFLSMWFSRSFRKSFIFQGFPCSRVPRTFNILPPVYSLVNIFLKLILRFFDFLFLTLYITKQSPGFQPLRRRFICRPLLPPLSRSPAPITRLLLRCLSAALLLSRLASRFSRVPGSITFYYESIPHHFVIFVLCLLRIFT